jgi:predicted lipid-binding transport protein (Tim44 family)
MLALGMVFDADAKRMGGSRSFGKQSSNVTQQRQQAPAQQQPTQQQPAQQQAAPAAAGAGAAAAAAPRRNWGGMLGGIAAGLGIGWLLSHLGLGGAALSFLSNLILIALIAVAAIWLIRKFRGGAKGRQPAYAGAGANGRTDLGRTEIGRNAEPTWRQPAASTEPLMPVNQPAAQPAFQPVEAAAGAAAVAQPWGVPADFDTEAFLRNAKVYFVRLQAAWDASNLDDIREFTTPEMFAEIKMDLGERGAEVNKTDVVTLDAALLGIETSPAQYLASVRFSGMMREKAGEAAQPFAEVWNLAKPVSGEGGWLLAGIQQEG